MGDHSAISHLGITQAQLDAAPKIIPQLKMIQRTMRRAGQRQTIIQRTITHPANSAERIAASERITESIPAPYGPGGDIVKSWPTYLEASEDPSAQKVMRVYRGYLAILRADHAMTPIEAFCVAANVSPLRILEILVGTLVRMGAQASTIIAAVNQPRMVQKMVEVGLTDEGFSDRALLARATGFLPTPAGPRTTVNVNQNASATANAQAATVIAPPPEQTIRRLSDRFHAILSANAPAALSEADTSRDISIASSQSAIPSYASLEEENDE